MPQENSAFTPRDAQSVIQIARSAPLQNMDAAEAVNELLARFAVWANEHFNHNQAPTEAQERRSEPTPDPATPRIRPTAEALRAIGLDANGQPLRDDER